MNWLKRLLRSTNALAQARTDQEQALLIQLAVAPLPNDHVVDDIAALEDELMVALGTAGEHDGHEIGGGEATIYMYGPDAEAMFRAVEPVLRAHVMTAGAVAIIRFGPPDSPQRQVSISR